MRANGLTWIYRFQTTRPSDGARVENTKVIGLVKDTGVSGAAAWKEVGRLGLDNNIERQLGRKPAHLRPAVVKAGAIPAGYRGRFGRHNLRHSLAKYFAANDVNLPLIQGMRHTKPETTAIYTHSVNSA
jgi:hypothetical protein